MTDNGSEPADGGSSIGHTIRPTALDRCLIRRSRMQSSNPGIEIRKTATQAEGTGHFTDEAHLNVSSTELDLTIPLSEILIPACLITGR